MRQVLFLGCLALSACSGQTPAPARAASAAGFPRTVALPGGASLVVPALPVRVVPASSTAVDLVAALLPPERVAGLPEQALDYSSLADKPGAWARLPTFYSYLAEPVLALLPDVVMADPWNQPETTARLREAGLTLFLLPEVKNWPDARALLVLAGKVLGADERAASLAAELDLRVAELREAAAARGPVRALTYSNFGGSGWSAGSGTTVHAIMELCGVENAAAAGGRTGHFSIGFEQLLTLDPDVILTSLPLREGAGPAGDRGGASRELLLSEPRLRGLKAVRTGSVLALPARYLATGSHELVTAAEGLSRELARWHARAGGAEGARQ